MLLLCPATTAQQLEPNPNPVDNTITVPVATSAENLVDFDNLGTIDNSGTITNRASGTIYNDGAIYNNELTGYIYNEYLGTIYNSGTIDNSHWFENDGTIDNQGTTNNQGFIHNLQSGTIDNSGDIVIWEFGGVINDGTIDNSGTLDNIGFFENHGIFKGTGTFVGTLDTGDGMVAPGSSAGTMYVDGDYILYGSGILDIEIGGFDAGEYDLLDITGTAFLPGGNINFSFLDGYDIVTDVGPGETWELSFLNAGYIDSLFDPVINYNFGSLPYFEFDVFKLDNDLIFQATNTVPVPAAVLLGILGLGVVGIKLRKYA